MFPNYTWIGSLILILIIIILDFYLLLILKKNTIKNSVIFFLAWIFLAIFTGKLIIIYSGVNIALEYIASYLVELLLSIDNVIAFISIFQFFNIKNIFKHKILIIGVLSALIFRLVFIIFSVFTFSTFRWIIPLLGSALLYNSHQFQLHYKVSKPKLFKNAFITQITKKYFNYDKKCNSGKFYYYKNNKFFITPLLFALIVVEKTDIMFALDSIPAVLAITKEPFIIFSSNILAILSLRSMYFIISNISKDCKYFLHAVRYISSYIGIKIIFSFFNIHFSNYFLIFMMILLIFYFMILSIITVHLKKKNKII